jgi:hypothetical protein
MLLSGAYALNFRSETRKKTAGQCLFSRFCGIVTIVA